MENSIYHSDALYNCFKQLNLCRTFISTDVSLDTEEILKYYIARWPIEVFFCQSKQILALDRYQVRSA